MPAGERCTPGGKTHGCGAARRLQEMSSPPAVEPAQLPCPGCGYPNRWTARFCGACGLALSQVPSPVATGEGESEGTPSADRHESGPLALPTTTTPFLALAISIGLALLAQTALLRTRAALPAVPMFVLACAIGGWVALRMLPAAPRAAFEAFRKPSVGRAWKLGLGLAVVVNAAGLALFGRGAALTLAWLLFAASVILVGAAFWLLDGRPGLHVDWRDEGPWLVALATILAAAAALRLWSLGSVPFGVWFDEAYSGLQVERIIADPSFRPVYVGGLAQEPSLLWYLMLPALKLFGPSQLALRLPTAIGGALGVPAIYLLGRELFGRKTGLIAAGLLATLVWHLTFSRLAFNSELSVTLDALGLFFLVRALKKGSWTAAALAGISLGLGLHLYYTSRLMILVAGLAVLAFWLPSARAGWQAVWRTLLAAAVAGVITASPIAEFAIQHPAEFNSRLQQASIFGDVHDQHSYAPVVQNLKSHALMFNLAGDRNARHNLPGQPELNFLLGGLFVLGLGISLARARRPEYLMLPAWGALMLIGGVFSVSFEAPQSLRTIDEINVVVLLCALPLALLWQACEKLPSVAPVSQPKEIPLPRPLQRAWDWAQVHAVAALLPVWLVAALWLTDPLYRHLTTAVPAGFDSAQFLWNLWWVKYSIVNLHQSPFHSHYLFAPQELNLAFHTLTSLLGLLSIPVQLTLGLFAAFNFVLLGSLLATSVAAFLLIRQETGSAAGALVGSLIFTYAPYKMAHLSAGHLTVVTTWAVPLFVLFLLRWLRGGNRRDALIAGVFLGCAGLIDLNQLVLTFCLGAVVVLGFTLTRLRGWTASGRLSDRLRLQLIGVGMLGAPALILLSPVLAALLDGLRAGWATTTPIAAPTAWSPDLLGYVVPLPLHPWWRSFGLGVAQRFHFDDPARLVFIGYAALLLSAIGAAARGSNARKWGLVALGFWLLSLGPLLHVGGVAFNFPMPFVAFHALPLIGGIANPGYFSLLFMLAVAIVAAHGASWLAAVLKRGALVPAILAVIVGIESLITPLPMFQPSVDPVYQRIGAEAGAQSILVLPVGWVTELGGEGDFDIAEMYFATVAHKPIVGGDVSRVPRRYFDYYRQQPALGPLLFPDRAAAPESQQRELVSQALRQLDVDYIVLRHWPRYNQQLTYIRQTLGYDSFFEDAEVSAFRVPR
ncbi:MAG TPA: glycosyltransferase family 39 protein [Chloroflexota bacterium]|nr:glycosyltransferase family 39 protein [Chloroflexota bacterium]